MIFLCWVCSESDSFTGSEKKKLFIYKNYTKFFLPVSSTLVCFRSNGSGGLMAITSLMVDPIIIIFIPGTIFDSFRVATSFKLPEDNNYTMLRPERVKN